MVSAALKNTPFSMPILGALIAASVIIGVLAPPLVVMASLLVALCGGLFWLYPRTMLTAFCMFSLILEWFSALMERLISPDMAIIRNSDEAMIAVFSVLTAWRMYREKRTLDLSLVELTILGMVAVGLVSSIRQSVPLGVAAPGMFLIVKGPLVYYIVRSLDYQQRHLENITRTFLWATGIILFFAGLEAVNPVAFRQLWWGHGNFDTRLGLIALHSLFYHPGDFGWFSAFISLYFFSFYLVLGRARYLFASIALSIGAFLSLRRKPLAGLLAGGTTGVFAMSFRKQLSTGMRTRIVMASILVFIIAFATVGEEVTQLMTDAVTQYFDEESAMAQARNILTLGSIKIGIDYFPFGVGFGRYGSWLSWMDYSPVYYDLGISGVWGLSPEYPNFIADTFWPMILGETGIVGLVLYIWMCGFIIANLWRGIPAMEDPLKKIFVTAALLIFVEGLVESIALPIFSKPPQAYLLFASAGLAMSILRSNEPPANR